MKYLILLIISLFCLTSFSDHKKDPVSKEERDRYKDLFASYALTEEEKKEYKALKERVHEEALSLKKHFNPYMWLEYFLFNAEKGSADHQFVLYQIFTEHHFKDQPRDPSLNNTYYPHVNILFSDIPDCTKKLLHKNECLKPPHLSIYWAKRMLYEGSCPTMGAEIMILLMEFFVIPATDIRGHESLFYTLYYIAQFMLIQIDNIRIPLITPQRIKQAQEDLKDRLLSKKEFEQKLTDLKKYPELKNKMNQEKLEKIKQKLSPKDQKLADKKISDLIQKWTEKYGKDEIYKCKRNFFDPSDLQREFLDKHYPYLD